MKIYVVNELCEVDCNYNNCHKAFISEEEAINYAEEIFDKAFNDLGREDKCGIYDISDDKHDYQICNDNYNIEVHINEIELVGMLEL